MEISKIVLTAGGLGTRFLPYTKAIPKEMLPILTKPVIQYVIEEALNSELSHFFIVTNRNKHIIADHIDAAHDLNAVLAERSQEDLLACTRRLARLGTYAFIRQSEPLGMGHAIMLAQQCIGKEYFAVAAPDDLIDSPDPLLKQLIRVARQEKGSIIAVQEVPNSCLATSQVISIKKTITPSLFQVSGIVDRPLPKNTPSNLAVVGRFVLSHKIFSALEYVSNYNDDHEISLSQAISHMIHDNERVFAYKISNTRYDLSTPLGWLKAVIGFGLKNPQFAPHIKTILEESNSSQSILYNPARALEQNEL